MALQPRKINSQASDKEKAPNVAYVREDVNNALPTWQLVKDCIDGERAVKLATEKYLPVPDKEFGGLVTSARYASYILRAVFYGVTGRTLTGLVGQVFGREATIELPTSLESFLTDVGGDGVSIEQQAKKGLEFVLSFGRAGLLADFPDVGDRPVTRAQLQSGEIRPIIKLYRPENIINWRTRRVGSVIKLSLVVLVETMDVNDDGFEINTVVAYRVLRLDENNNYTVTIYTEDTDAGRRTIKEFGQTITPTKADGSKFTEIPFSFLGPENNDATIDASPLAPMAAINVAHYRNSADYEDSCFMTGQPTPVFSGLTEEWVANVMHGKVHLGARGGVMLPKGGTADLLQITGNTMPKEAMDHKEHQMVALGAKLVEERSIRRTATEARQDEASETSILSSSTKNVNRGYELVIAWALEFTPDSGADFKFKLNSDFDLSSMTAQERQQLIAEWQAEAISFTEMRTSLKRTRIAYQDDDEMVSEVKENPPVKVSDAVTREATAKIAIEQTTAAAAASAAAAPKKPAPA